MRFSNKYLQSGVIISILTIDSIMMQYDSIAISASNNDVTHP